MTHYQRLQPFFDAYNSKITDARNQHHMSLNDLSEAAGGELLRHSHAERRNCLQSEAV